MSSIHVAYGHGLRDCQIWHGRVRDRHLSYDFYRAKGQHPSCTEAAICSKRHILHLEPHYEPCIPQHSLRDLAETRGKGFKHVQNLRQINNFKASIAPACSPQPASAPLDLTWVQKRKGQTAFHVAMLDYQKGTDAILLAMIACNPIQPCSPAGAELVPMPHLGIVRGKLLANEAYDRPCFPKHVSHCTGYPNPDFPEQCQLILCNVAKNVDLQTFFRYRRGSCSPTKWP